MTLEYARLPNTLKKKINITEVDLIELLKDGDEKGLEVLYKNYSKALYNVIFSILQDDESGEEVLQESFLSIAKNAPYFDKSKSSIFTWMLNICRNLAKERKRTNDLKKDSAEENLASSNTNQTLSNSISSDLTGRDHLRDKLNPELHHVLDLIFLRGLNAMQVAEAMKLPLEIVKVRSRNAILELRKYFSIALVFLTTLLSIL